MSKQINQTKPTLYKFKINLSETKPGTHEVPKKVVEKYLPPKSENKPQYLPISYDTYVSKIYKECPEKPSKKIEEVIEEELLNPKEEGELAKKVNDLKRSERVKGTQSAKSAFNIFREVKEGDLFWTIDHNDNCWICRVTGKPEPRWEPVPTDPGKDTEETMITAVLPVEAHCVQGEHGSSKIKFGREIIPGAIKASFMYGTCTHISASGDKDRLHAVELFSKYIFNELSNRKEYPIDKSRIEGNSKKDSLFAFFLPEVFEELVIAYIQDQYNLRVRIDSITSSGGKNITKSIECELYITSDKEIRCTNTKKKIDDSEHRTAVVQVKASKQGLNPETQIADGITYRTKYAENEHGAKSHVFFYDGGVSTPPDFKKEKHFTWITKDELWDFYEKNKNYWPSSIKIWETIWESIPNDTKPDAK